MPAVAFAKGSAGLKAMQIVEGETDMYTSSFNKISLWDICAAHAILSAIGGSLCTLKLTPIDYSRRYLTDGLFFHQVIAHTVPCWALACLGSWLAFHSSV
jgi:3'-phosphoadenosine 5'-phosphosulfate (PAPS) 3'-phosphatase